MEYENEIRALVVNFKKDHPNWNIHDICSSVCMSNFKFDIMDEHELYTIVRRIFEENNWSTAK